MKIRKIVISSIISFIFITFIFTFSSCYEFWMSESEDCEYPDYSDCDTNQPHSAFLQMQVTIDDNIDLLEVQLYNGDIEENDFYMNFTEVDSGLNYVEKEVLFEHHYSAKAIYLRDSDTIVCIDGTYIEYGSYTNCDSVCWYIKGDKIDLRIVQ